MKIYSKIPPYVMSFLRVAVTQGRFATVTPAPFPMPATTAFASQAKHMAEAPHRGRWTIASSIAVTTRTATRLASFGKPIIGALARCYSVPILSCSQFGEGEEYELIGGSQPL